MTTLPCGCRHNDSNWLRMCDPCKREHDERHLRAKAEKDSAELVGWYSLGSPDQPKPE